MGEKYNRLQHKQETPTTFRKFDEIGMFEAMKEAVVTSDGRVNQIKAVATFFVGLAALLVFLFSTIFVVRLALSIPL